MGKPWFGITNLALSDGTTISASSESSVYPASNLALHRIWPGWRSARKALLFDGATDRLRITDHADFDITDNLALYLTLMITEHTGPQYLISKLDASDGYLLQHHPENSLKLSLRNAGDTHACAVDITGYENTLLEILFTWSNADGAACWINGAAQSVSESGDAITAIGTNSVDVGIGALYSGSNPMSGYIQQCGIRSVAVSEWHVPDPSNCAGFWYMDDWATASTITDQSGNGHTATAYSLAEGDEVSLAGAHWLQFTYPDADTMPLAVLDRRHNLPTGAEIRFGRRAITSAGSGNKFVESAAVTAGEPVVIEGTAYNNFYGWFLLKSDALSPAYFEVPHMYIGQKSELSRSFLRGYEKSIVRNVGTIRGSGGSVDRFITGGNLWRYQISLHLDQSDREIIESAIESSAEGHPVVFCADGGSPAQTIFCHIDDPGNVRFKHRYASRFEVELSLTEVG